jgi:uncharacterized iron-regulated membrane protein
VARRLLFHRFVLTARTPGTEASAVVALRLTFQREMEGTMRYVMAALLALSLGVGQAWALFETNKKLAESARIPMDQAVKQATIEVPGKAVEAQLGKEDGRTVYEIDILDSTNKERTVYIDAQTGKTMKVKD